MIELPYCLIIEATDEPDFFGFYSPDLEGFTGIGHSVEDCLFQAKWGMQEFVQVMAERDMAIPPRSEEPTVLIKNSKRTPTTLRQRPLMADRRRLDPSLPCILSSRETRLKRRVLADGPADPRPCGR